MLKDETIILEYDEDEYEMLKTLAINEGKTIRQLIYDSTRSEAGLSGEANLSTETKIRDAVDDLQFCNEILDEYTNKMKDVLDSYLLNNSLDVEPQNNHSISMATYLSIINKYAKLACEFNEKIIKLTELQPFINDKELIQEEEEGLAGDAFFVSVKNKLQDLNCAMSRLLEKTEQLKKELEEEKQKNGKDGIN